MHRWKPITVKDSLKIILNALFKFELHSFVLHPSTLTFPIILLIPNISICRSPNNRHGYFQLKICIAYFNAAITYSTKHPAFSSSSTSSNNRKKSPNKRKRERKIYSSVRHYGRYHPARRSHLVSLYNDSIPADGRQLARDDRSISRGKRSVI